MNAADYSAIELLRDGRSIEIRALKPADRAGWLDFMTHTSDEARYRRFLSAKRNFDEREIDFHVNADFVQHVALAAVLGRGRDAIGLGGARYVVTQPGSAEIAFQIGDAHQRLGTATHLMRHLVILARDAGLVELTAEVLPENTPMLKVFERSGLPMTLRREESLLHVQFVL